MPEQDLPDQDPKAFNRRAFLRRAALTGVATAWVAPVVQSIAATPAFAQTVGQTPVPEDCFHSVGGPNDGGCMDACTSAGCTGSACDGTDPDPCNPHYGGEGPCQYLCPSGQGGDNPCCNPGLCNSAYFTCMDVPNCESGPPTVQIAVYSGPLAGCPPVA